MKIFLVVLVGIGLVSFAAWRSFFCPECLASERAPTSFLGSALQSGNKEEAISEESVVARGVITGSPQIGSSAPHFVLEDLDGAEVSLTDWAGQNVLLVFWATSCGWCEKERPDLVKFTQEHKGLIEVLAISGEPKGMLKEYVKTKQINFTLLWDPDGKTQAKYLAFGTPNHFMINRQGDIVAIRPGYATYENLSMLADFLGEE